MSDPTKPEIRFTNPSPKSRFMESSDNISKHRRLVDSPEFQRAEDFAMREYAARQMTKIGDANSAAGVGLKLLGAHEFMQTFRLLSETVRVQPAMKVVDHLPEVN